MKIIKKELHNLRDVFIDQLIELLKIPSISADPNYKNDVKKQRNGLKMHLMISAVLQFKSLKLEVTL